MKVASNCRLFGFMAVGKLSSFLIVADDIKKRVDIMECFDQYQNNEGLFREEYQRSYK
jgi:hypothetical protein